MNREFSLPDLGEGLEEAEIIEWRVSPGDTVAADQVFVEVETAKAAVEIPSPFAGVVTALHAAEGSVVSVGAPLITIAETPAAGAAMTGAPPTARQEPVALVPSAAPAGADGSADVSGPVLVGYGTSAHGSGTRPRAVPPPPLLPPAASETKPGRPPARTPLATPPVRAVARRLGVDLATIAPTDGKVTREQVRAAAAADADARPGNEGVREVVPVRGVRRAIAEKVSRSRRDIPEATAWVEADVTDLWRAMQEMTEAAQRPIRFFPVVCRAVVAALAAYPVMNSRLSADGSRIDVLAPVHLGIAASTERGLVVPVIRDADRRSIAELSEAIGSLVVRARQDMLSPRELIGGTFTVNNYGVLGVDGGDPIINAPEAAILGVGRAINRPWVVGDQLAVRRTVELVISADHRIVDGREAGGFLRRVADLLETPPLLWSSL